MLFEIMQSALILNRVRFVELLMDNGVNLKDFLTKRRLLKLYNHVCCHLKLSICAPSFPYLIQF